MPFKEGQFPQSEEPQEDLSSQEHEQTGWEHAVTEKFWACTRLGKNMIKREAPHHSNVRNLALTGRYLYAAIFRPAEFPHDILQEANPADQAVIQSMVTINTEPPTEEEFIAKFRHVLTNEMPFEETVHPEALNEVREMAEMGPVVVWTKGDVHGIPEMEDAPGSKEQTKKIARSGLNRLRHGLREEGKILTFVAAEDKLAALQSMIPELEREGIEKIVVVDDRAGNLIELQQLAQQHGITQEIILVWDREWEKTQENSKPRVPKAFQDSLEEMQQTYQLITVDSLTKVRESVSERLEGQKPAWIVDYDDVLADDTRKSALQEQELIAWLEPYFSPKTE